MMFIWYKEIAKKHNFQCVSYMYIQACTKRTVCSSTFTGEIFQTRLNIVKNNGQDIQKQQYKITYENH